MKSDFALLTRHIRKLRGGSQPILAQASDGLQYVVKFTNNLQGPNLPFNESAGCELYRACGLAGPSWRTLMVTDTFLDQNPGCWIQTPTGHLRPDRGACFGSRFLGGAGVDLQEILPGTSLRRVRNHQSFWLAWLIDICAEHADNRQAIFVKDDAGWLDAFFVDHGHLFGGPNGELRRHFEASRYLDPRIYQNLPSEDLLSFQRVARSLDVDKLWQSAQLLPDEWKTSSALSKYGQCLGRLSTSRLLQNIVWTMVGAQRQASERMESSVRYERKPPHRFSPVVCRLQD